MNASVVQITQQIEFLHPKYLEELNLFVEFLITKQQKEVKPSSKEKKDLIPTTEPDAPKNKTKNSIQKLHGVIELPNNFDYKETLVDVISEKYNL